MEPEVHSMMEYERPDRWLVLGVLLLTLGVLTMFAYLGGGHSIHLLPIFIIDTAILVLVAHWTISGEGFFQPLKDVQGIIGSFALSLFVYHWVSILTAVLGHVIDQEHPFFLPTEGFGQWGQDLSDWAVLAAVWSLFSVAIVSVGLRCHARSRRSHRWGMWILVLVTGWGVENSPLAIDSELMLFFPMLWVTPLLVALILLDAPWPWVLRREREARQAAESPT